VRQHHIHAAVDAVAHIDIQTPRLTKQRFVAGGAVAVAMAGRFLPGIRLRYHNHPTAKRHPLGVSPAGSR